MSNCIHAVVCRHIDDKKHCTNCGEKVIIATEAGCDLEDICKHLQDKQPVAQKARQRKKKKASKKGTSGKGKRRAKPGDHKLDRDYTVSNADMGIIRGHLRKWRREGKLTENQLTAIGAIGNVRTPKLTDVQREQFLSIFNEIKKARS